jgi:hypothetical protein
VLEDAGEVRLLRLAELEQVVLDVDVVVGARQAEPGRRFERVAAGVVEPSDERLEVGGHARVMLVRRLVGG